MVGVADEDSGGGCPCPAGLQEVWCANVQVGIRLVRVPSAAEVEVPQVWEHHYPDDTLGKYFTAAFCWHIRPGC